MGLEHNATPGDIYRHEDGSIYRVVGYQANPTVIVERICGSMGEELGSSEFVRETHAVGCLNAKPFTRLK